MVLLLFLMVLMWMMMVVVVVVVDVVYLPLWLFIGRLLSCGLMQPIVG